LVIIKKDDMSNRIEDAIRQLIMKRRQQDALLENIIKHSLFEDDEPAAKKATGRKTVLKKAPKDVRAAAAKYGGIAYRVVIRGRNLSIGEINNIVYGKTSGNAQIGRMSPPYNQGYVYVISTASDASTADEKFSYYIVNVLVLPNSTLDKYKRNTEITSGGYIGEIGNSIMINAERFADEYNVPQEIIDALEVKRISKYELKQIFTQDSKPNASVPATTNAEFETETDVISDVTDQPIGNKGGVFTGKYNATKGIPIQGIFKIRNTTLDGTFSYDATSNHWWFSNGTWKTPDQIRIGTFTENGVFTDGEYQFTNREVVTSMPDVSYRVYHGFKTAGDIDTKNNKSKIFVYNASNKVISYYEGTFNLDGDPNNGTLYTDDTKSTITGTFTNGKYVETTK
jgi:hypothetical protein